MCLNKLYVDNAIDCFEVACGKVIIIYLCRVSQCYSSILV